MTRDVIKMRHDQAAAAPASDASGQSSGRRNNTKSRECPVVQIADDGSIEWVINSSGGAQRESLNRRAVAAAMKEAVLITLAVDMETGRIDPKTPFMVNSGRRGPRYNRPYEVEPGVIEQFRLGENQARFEAEWDDETGNWIFGKRVDDAPSLTGAQWH
jgi:hypothetical protein